MFLIDDRLPPLERWDEQFRRIVNDSYVLRGAEVSLTGTVEIRDDKLFLAGNGRRPAVQLAPLNPASKVQWDRATRAPQLALPDEVAAYMTIAPEISGGTMPAVTVTGPISHTGSGYVLEVREVRR